MFFLSSSFTILVAAEHFGRNRYRCFGCLNEFCSSCLEVPYHKGYTCAEFASPKCRFCNLPVPERLRSALPDLKDQMVSAQSFLFQLIFELVLCQICNAPQCEQSARLCCVKTLHCGHRCYGYKGEQICPPCLYSSCPSHPPLLPAGWLAKALAITCSLDLF